MIVEAISQFFCSIFGDNSVLATILISIIPLIELKGAIPFGMSKQFWGENALSGWQAFFYAFIGGVIITIILAFIFKPIYNAIKDKKFFKSIVNFFTGSIKKKSEQLENSSTEISEKRKLLKKLLATFIFVAIPVPGTGVYTGTCLAILLGLSPWWSILAVTLGNFTAGIIIMTICQIFPQFTTILFFIFIVFILALLAYKIVAHIINKKRENNAAENCKIDLKNENDANENDENKK